MRFLDKANRQTLPPDAMPPVSGVEGGEVPRGRGWKLFLAWVIVPPALLCIAELGLRMGGFGVSTQLFLPREVRGTTVCVPNRAFYQQFYTAPIGDLPHAFSMPTPKPPDTCRVFVFGSSAAQGVPTPDFSFWRILETMLRARTHGGRTEIYSLAMAGADSHVMRAAAKACAACQPDLFLVYMGNNELNPLVAQNLVWDRFPPWLALRCLRLNIALNDLKLVQMLHGIKGTGDVWRPNVSSGGIQPERAYRYYQANVNDICAFAKAAGAQVVLCTVGTRLREWIPEGKHATAIDSKAAQQWDEAYDAGNTLRGQERFQDALTAYTRAATIDSGHAGLAYGIACCHYALGEYADARPWFVRARELDVNLFRARDRINAILREIATTRSRDGVRLADTAQSLADTSPHGIEGPELFLDNVHLSFEGNYALARSVLETFTPMEPRLDAQDPPPSIEECRLRLAMTQPDLRDQLEMTAKLNVFMEGQPKDRIERAVAELDTQIGTQADDMRLEGYHRALEIDPKNEPVQTKYVRLLMNKGETAQALEQAKVLTANFPYSCESLCLLAQLFETTGDRTRAIETMRLVLDLRPDDADASMRLGQYLYEDDQPEAALAAFRASFGLRPDAGAQCGIGRALLRRGDPSGAIKAYRHSLALKPGDPVVFGELIAALCDANRQTEAKGEMDRWVAANGEHEPATAGLYEKVGRMQDALRLLESGVVSSGGDAASCAALEAFLGRNASVIPPPPVWKKLAEKTPSARVSEACERSLGDTVGYYEKEGRMQDALRLLESKVISSGGDAVSCAALEAFLKKNASKVSAPQEWKELAEKTSSARVWRAYEGSLDEKDAETRMGVLRQLLRIAPDAHDAASTLQGLLDGKAARLEAAGDLPGAVGAYREAIPLNPQNHQPVQGLEKALSGSSPAERRAAWETVWKDNPGNPLVAAFCGTARASTSDISAAKEAFEAVQRLAPEEWSYCVMAADALAAADAWADAANAYERALALNPGLDYLRGRLDAAKTRAAEHLRTQETAAPPPSAP